jgi:prepilin-type N-terminal cleavage/methylation domain-containing protein
MKLKISKKRAGRKAFTLVEVLASIAILAMLAAAVAVAMEASINSYQENQDISKAMNTARQALLRMITQIRTAQAVNTTDPSNQCSLITNDGKDITYRYDSAAKTLYIDYNSTGTSHKLCENVISLNFTRAAKPDDATRIRNVQIVLEVEVDNAVRKLASAAVLRKNL